MIVERPEPEIVGAIVNQAAQAYRGVIPADRWKDPYMPADELRREIARGVSFLGFAGADGVPVGVMGVQDVGDARLIRHAYVRPDAQRRGVGGALLAAIRARADKPLLVGTWAAAGWAIAFYRGRGFRLAAPDEAARLLRTYWSVPERQIETSVVLGDDRWFAAAGGR